MWTIVFSVYGAQTTGKEEEILLVLSLSDRQRGGDSTMEENIVQREVEEGGGEGEEMQRLLGLWGRLDLQDSSVK